MALSLWAEKILREEIPEIKRVEFTSTNKQTSNERKEGSIVPRLSHG